MATSSATIEYILDQLRGVPTAQAKKMFGEYCLYVEGKPVALVCDDTVFLKPSASCVALPPNTEQGLPFSRAKPHPILGADVLENHVLFAQILQQTAAGVPEPKPKTKTPKTPKIKLNLKP